jgi:hypothetical protein
MAGIPESLVQLVQALADDEHLRAWFESLAMFSPRERGAEFQSVAARMKAEQHPELAHAVALLAAPGMYEAVQAAVSELAGKE